MAQAKSKSKSKSAPKGPARAVITCMDYRIKDEQILSELRRLGWPGDGAYILRNAGGSVTEDVIRSLMMLQKFVLGIYNIDIAVITHTGCGMQAGGEDHLRSQIEADSAIGITPPFALETFPTPAHAVRRSARRLRTSRFVSSRTPQGLRIRGFVYDIDRLTLTEVSTI